MPHTDTTPVSASIASTGTGVRYIGNHLFGLSGSLDANGTNTYLEFTSGSGYARVAIQCYNNDSTSEQIKWVITFNDITIIQFYQEGRGSAFRGQGVDNDLIIPPFTNVKITGDNNQQVFGSVVMVGRVYGAE